MAVQIESDVRRAAGIESLSYRSGPFFIPEMNPASKNGALRFIFHISRYLLRF